LAKTLVPTQFQLETKNREKWTNESSKGRKNTLFRAEFGQPEVFYEFQATNENPNKFKPTKIKTIERKIIF
jgi:hypothetical protein